MIFLELREASLPYNRRAIPQLQIYGMHVGDHTDFFKNGQERSGASGIYTTDRTQKVSSTRIAIIIKLPGQLPSVGND